MALLAVAAIRSRRLRWRVLCALLATAVPAWLPPRAQAPTPPRLVALDVGAGDALLLQGTSGTLLVDAGYAVSGGGVGAMLYVDAFERDHTPRADMVAIRRNAGATSLAAAAPRASSSSELCGLSRGRAFPVIGALSRPFRDGDAARRLCSPPQNATGIRSIAQAVAAKQASATSDV